jgi:hypothetical protein
MAGGRPRRAARAVAIRRWNNVVGRGICHSVVSNRI